jgi:hypothetical protein
MVMESSRRWRAATGALTLSHDEIKGFMPAMEMMYRVRAPEVSHNLKPGDTIDFTIDAAKTRYATSRSSLTPSQGRGSSQSRLSDDRGRGSQLNGR